MKIRHGWPLAVTLILASCSWMPFGHRTVPKQQTLMKSVHGEVDYRLSSPLPPDAYLLVTLAVISRQDASARIVASERIAPIGSSPVSFVLGYEPDKVANGMDFTVSASIKQGDRTLASNDTQARVLGKFGYNGPVLVRISP